MSNGIAVEVQNVERTYGQGENAAHVLRGANLKVCPGELVALYGPSGSGKTTLLNLIGALDKPSMGQILFNGKDIVRLSERARAVLRRTQIGFIFQSSALLPTYTAWENVDLALRLHRLGYRERQRRTKAVLDAMGLSAWAHHSPDELSGGQQQRVAIARALALQTPLVLADEVTAGLDTRTAKYTLKLFQGIARKQGTTFIIVTHDPMIAELADAVYDLQDGQLIPRTHPFDSTVEKES
jgi:ABC-type lipoprotein export system ATPase subunit